MNKINLVIKQIGDRQGGQHGVVRWLMAQFNGIYFWKNNAGIRHNILEISKFPDMSLFKKNKKIFIDENLIAIFAGYEDTTLARVNRFEFLKFADKQYNIIVLRDPYNLFASKIYNWTKNSPHKRQQYSKKLKVWKQKAREVLNKECYFINFNKWFVNKKYRKEIISWFPEFTFTDDNKELVRGLGKSSFDKKEFNGKASQMNLLKRYKTVIDDPLMKNLIEDKEVTELSNQIFGKII